MSSYQRDEQDAAELEEKRRVVKYPVAERFKAVQGEGLYTGVPMAFIRLVGCSVGHKVCTACDTQFDQTYPHLGGGLYSVEELAEWVGNYQHVCITGGEPLDRDLRPLLVALVGKLCHIETSGTKHPKWLSEVHFDDAVWITVSPKPGYLQAMLDITDEIKVIIGGLGDGLGWPTVFDAEKWAKEGKLVYIQPRNGENDIDVQHMQQALELVDKMPSLRLSIQAHKYLNVR
jgi:organic radical activating enzyme